MKLNSHSEIISLQVLFPMINIEANQALKKSYYMT